ncbi:MAG: ABC transporter substrate-binding protein [Gemmiger sp.]|nr:ABC transporter substrate-binding protein [Gemmiger sp.]
MKRNTHTAISLLLALALVVSLLCGCAGGAPSSVSSAAPAGSTAGEASSAPGALEEATLVMYVIGGEPVGFPDMLVEFNKLLKEELNATLEVNWLGFADYLTQYPLLLSSGDPVDLIYTATWTNYYQEARKGAFLPLEELGPQYAPKTWAQITDAAKFQATVGEHVYAIPSGKDTYSAWGIAARGDLMQKYGVDPITDWAGYEAYMDAIKANEPNMQPSGVYADGKQQDDVVALSRGYYPLTGSTGSPYWIDPSQEHPTVFFVTEYPEFQQDLAMYDRWAEKGFWPADALANQDSTMQETGKSASQIHNVDWWRDLCILRPEWDFQWYEMTNHVEIQSAMQDGMAIPTSAKNPERALMLLEKLRTDPRYYDLFVYGIPGVHSNILEDGTVEALNPDVFPLDSCGWGFRTNELTRLPTGLPDSYGKAVESLKNSVKENKYRSFFMDTDSIKSEYSAIQNIMSQYYTPLVLGMTDPVAGMEEINKQLEAADNEKVKAEIQRQLDEFITKWDAGH